MPITLPSKGWDTGSRVHAQLHVHQYQLLSGVHGAPPFRVMPTGTHLFTPHADAMRDICAHRCLCAQCNATFTAGTCHLSTTRPGHVLGALAHALNANDHWWALARTATHAQAQLGSPQVLKGHAAMADVGTKPAAAEARTSASDDAQQHHQQVAYR